MTWLKVSVEVFNSYDVTYVEKSVQGLTITLHSFQLPGMNILYSGYIEYIEFAYPTL